MSRRLRRTKIVTTLGPVTDRDNNLEKVIAAGANVVRLNFLHGSAESARNLGPARPARGDTRRFAGAEDPRFDVS